jgi:hypothetical protein
MAKVKEKFITIKHEGVVYKIKKEDVDYVYGLYLCTDKNGKILLKF